MASLKVACMVAVVFMVVVSAHMAHAITCNQVASYVAPCFSYLTKGGNPSVGCCSGVKNLNSQAKTTADRKTTCNCLKQLSGSASGINPGNAASLPGKCKVNVPYKISTSTNCNTIK
ncbi:non-specific lipid-transfer protein 1-like [Vigna umbellata]|uniref:non-specific lipid-transfer protein 1-like n=1 Tax=Vigna umbellata TaxID=87088 RepID=UPI001F5FC90D|nr:non-specific lipid-transfer protein 1-like [Vigna umbellata]